MAWPAFLKSGMQIRHIFTLLLAIIVPVTGAMAEVRSIPGVIGTDDRVAVDSAEYPWPAVGHINIAGFRDRQFCSGTLIAPDLVVTAAHCLYDKRSGGFHKASSIHFVAGVRRDVAQGHSVGACISSPVSQFYQRRRIPVDLDKDIALLRLRNPIPLERAVPISTKEITPDLSLTHAGYPRDRRFLPSVHKSCRAIKRRSRLIFTSCDTNFGASGGPVFVGEGEAARLAGVMIGVNRGDYSIAISLPDWRDFLFEDICARK